MMRKFKRGVCEALPIMLTVLKLAIVGGILNAPTFLGVIRGNSAWLLLTLGTFPISYGLAKMWWD